MSGSIASKPYEGHAASFEGRAGASVSNLLLLVGCLVVGMLLRRSGRAPTNAHQGLNVVILHVSLPAVTLRTLHAFTFDPAQLGPVLMPWLLFAIGATAFWAIGRWLQLARASIGALTLVGGLGNTSFVGLPMIESLNGRDGLGLGLLIDQLGSYMVLSTLGVFVTALYAGGAKQTGRAVLCKIAVFPPFVALMLALALRPLPLPAAIDTTLLRRDHQVGSENR
jgi:predicted permease